MVVSYDLFTDIVKSSFLGNPLSVASKSYSLEHTVLRKYDFLRKTPEFGSKSEMNRLFSDLPPDFISSAKSELYRKSSGWIERGYNERKVKQFQIQSDHFLVPILSKPAIGIDTSGNSGDRFVCFAFYDNYKAAYHYFEKFLDIPKTTGQRAEFKWNKLNPTYRAKLDGELDNILGMSCEFVLIIKTNALDCTDEKIIDVFIKLIEGCFSNYEHKSKDRSNLKDKLFQLANENPIHCDADFNPLGPDKIVKQFVKILSNGKDHTPLHAEKDSHESEPIQVTDILCGILKDRIIYKKHEGLIPLEFHNKLKSDEVQRDAKCYCWERNLSLE